VIIDAILKPGIALRVRAGLAFEHDRAAVRQMSRFQTSSTRRWPNCTLLSYWPMIRVPCGTSRMRPVGLS
jgi:hypothetical protein